MSYRDIWFQQAERARKDAENAAAAWPSMFGPNGYGVPRLLPPAPPRPRRAWEELVEINRQIRQGYLERLGRLT